MVVTDEQLRPSLVSSQATSEWPAFVPNRFGYMFREVQGLRAGYFVADQGAGRLHIIKSATGSTRACVRCRRDGLWHFEGYWCAGPRAFPRFHDTGDGFDHPRLAVLHFNRYIEVLCDPSIATLVEYLRYGGKRETHRRAVQSSLIARRAIAIEVLADYPDLQSGAKAAGAVHAFNPS